MDRVQRSRDLRGDAQRRARRKTLVDARGERAGGQILHRDAGMLAGEALVVDARDVLDLELGEELVLAHEALEEHLVLPHAGIEHLERDAQAVVVALGEIDLRLPAFPDTLHQREAWHQGFFHQGICCHAQRFTQRNSWRDRLPSQTARVRSGRQSPMSCQGETMRAPLASSRCRRGRNLRFMSGERKSVTTLARPSSVTSRSSWRKVMRSTSPAAAALLRASAMRSGSISTQTPRAP